MAWQELLQRLRLCCNNTIRNPDPKRLAILSR
jgi:hypothetical protein